MDSLLLPSSVPSTFWSEAILTIVFSINRIPYVITSSIYLFEQLSGMPPDYFSLRIFGCTCCVMLSLASPYETLCLFSDVCFLGYGVGQKGY